MYTVGRKHRAKYVINRELREYILDNITNKLSNTYKINSFVAMFLKDIYQFAGVSKMVQNDKRIRIITGHYGSGKTEFAVNYAIKLREVFPKVALSDLDIVNVYFRSRERREELENLGIQVIASSIEGDSADLPAVSAAITTPVRDTSCQYVIDLGGNDVGTMVLGRLKPLLKPEETDFFMVVNVYRPGTSTVEDIIAQMQSLERSSGLKITGLINNTNLIRETTVATLQEGDVVLKKVSEVTGVPIKYVSYINELIKETLPASINGEMFPLKFYMRKEWM